MSFTVKGTGHPASYSDVAIRKRAPGSAMSLFASVYSDAVEGEFCEAQLGCFITI